MMYSSSSKVVRMRTFGLTPVGRGLEVIAAVASSPSMTGMRMSMRITSTGTTPSLSIAILPLLASITTFMSS